MRAARQLKLVTKDKAAKEFSMAGTDPTSRDLISARDQKSFKLVADMLGTILAEKPALGRELLLAEVRRLALTGSGEVRPSFPMMSIKEIMAALADSLDVTPAELKPFKQVVREISQGVIADDMSKASARPE